MTPLALIGRIEKLKLKNFKSFKSALIPIAPGYTTIVGPNGSGKSNLVDAICFVVGTTSMKNLRADRLTDLVHHSAKDIEAEVELHVKDNGGETHVISRSIDKSGTSVFRLNNRRTTKFNIDELLSMMNIRPDGHNIIMQGDVTRFIKMTPAQRREIIDEVCGIAEYESKKEESLKELGKVEEKLREAEIVLSERKGYLQTLEKEKIEAEVYLDLKKNHRIYQGTLVKKELESIEKSFGKSLDFLAKAKERLVKLEGEKSDILKHLKEIGKKSDELMREIYKESEKRQSAVRSEVEEVKTSIATLEEKMNNFRDNIEKGRGKREELAKRISNVGLDIKKKEEEIEDLEFEEEKKTKDLKRLEQEFGSKAPSDLTSLYRNLEEVNKAIDERKEKLYDILADMKGLTETLNLKKALSEEISLEAQALEARNKGMRDKVSNLRTVMGIIDRIDRSLSTFEVYEEVREVSTKIREDLSQARSMLNELKETLLDLGFATKQNELENLQKELGALEITLIDKKQNSERLQNEIGKLDRERQVLKTKFAELGLGEKELTKAEQPLQKLREELNDIKVRRRTLKSEIEQVLLKRREDSQQEIENIDKELQNLEYEKQKVTEQRNGFLRVLKEKELKARELATSMSDMFETKGKLETQRDEFEDKLANLTTTIEALKSEINENELNKARHEVKFNDLKREVEKFVDVQVIEMTQKDLREKVEEVERQLETIGKVNMKAIEMFDKYSDDIKDIEKKREKLIEEKGSILNMIEEIEKKKLKVFGEAFDALNKNFDKYFKEFYPEEGSYAAIKLEDPARPLESGLLVEAKPAGKELRIIDLMSGGEKTLAALAFLFSIQAYSPSPFYILDEVDAALDKENSERLAKMLRKSSKELQFLLVTHNPSVIRSSDQIIGVHMSKEGSSFVEVDLKNYQPASETATVEKV